MRRAVLLAVVVAGWALAACSPAVPATGELVSGSSRVTMQEGTSCVDEASCGAPVIEVDSSGVVYSWVTQEVPVSVSLFPPEAPVVRVDADSSVWVVDVRDVPPGSYLMTLIASGDPFQVVLRVPSRG